ncbi:hypothetical protein [Streptomyces sp. NPDC001933]|uniref:hypothetical protein n=1 Tax=Streptomyces sp. NPDC001933 TaxID=3364626 RepID=UPI0036C86443
MLGGDHFAFGDGLGQEPVLVMAGGLGVGEGGDEGGPGRVGEDAVGLGGDGVADGGLEAVGRFVGGVFGG